MRKLVSSRSTRLHFAVLAGAPLCGCAGHIVGVEKIQSVPFVESSHTYVLASGTTSITGRASIESAGTTITCEPAGARLFPVTAFTSERMMIIYGAAASGFRPAYEVLTFKNEPPEFKKYFRETTCTSQGEFHFDGLATGEYYVVAGVVSKERVHSLNHGYLMKRVRTVEGTEAKVELHR